MGWIKPRSVFRNVTSARCGRLSIPSQFRIKTAIPWSTNILSSSPSRTLSTATASDRNNNHPYPTLFSPLDLGPCGVLPNRAIMGSMHTGLEGLSIPWYVSPFLKHSSEAHTLDRLAAYFAERARGGVGLMVTGGVAPNKAGWTGPFSSLLNSKRQVEQHRVVTQAVHDVGVPMGTGASNADETVPAAFVYKFCTPDDTPTIRGPCRRVLQNHPFHPLRPRPCRRDKFNKPNRILYKRQSTRNKRATMVSKL